MKQFPVIGQVAAVIIAVMFAWLGFACSPSSAKQNQVRHVVILMFKQSATKTQIAQIEHDFYELKSKIPQMVNIE